MNILEVHAEVLFKNRLLKLGVQGQHKFLTLTAFIEKKKRNENEENRKINRFQLLEAKQTEIKFKTVLKRHNIIDFTNIKRG